MEIKKKKHERVEKFIDRIDPDSIFVEIGTERGEGSTLFLADLAKQHGTRLLTVDLRPKTSICSPDTFWDLFYSQVRDASWPEKVASIDELPPRIKHECIQIHNWYQFENTMAQQQVENNNKLFWHSNIDWYMAPGSEWCKSYKDKINKPISFLYLDNFDYIWDIENVPDCVVDQVESYNHNWKITMNNQNCQLEHLLQLMFIVPHLTDSCVVAFDDTYLYNDCWIGKSGPGVVYLQALGFEIIDFSNKFVILKKIKSCIS